MILHWSSAWLFLVNFLFTVGALLFLSRFAMSWGPLNFSHPVVQSIGRLTWPVLRPLYHWSGRRVMRRDWWSLVVAIVLCGLDVAILAVIASRPLTGGLLALAALIKCATLLDDFYIFTLIVGALMSWIQPPYMQHPMTGFLYAINEPVLRPLRRLVPATGGLDFSPLLALAILFFINILLPSVRFG
jgi:YggT family protein